MISISLSEFEFNPNNYVPTDVFEIHLPFDRHRYKKIKNTLDCSYYLEMMDQGFKKASETKDIPLKQLLNIIEDFKNDGCKNEWLHKKKRFKDEDLEVFLNCVYTALHFELIITINRISDKKELLKSVLIRTEVGVSIHEGLYKDIFVKDNDVIITDKTDSPRIIINKNKIFKGILDYKVIGSKEIIEILSYQM